MSDYVQNISADNRLYQVKDLDAKFSRHYRHMLHHQEDEQKGGSGQTYSEQPIEAEVSPKISINALILFIENLLANNPLENSGRDPLDERLRKENYLAPWARSIYSEKNSYGVAPRQAVNAYTEALKTSRQSSPHVQSAIDDQEYYWKKDRLKILLGDLKDLRKKDVQYLTLEGHESSFMQSISLAVDRVLSLF